MKNKKYIAFGVALLALIGQRVHAAENVEMGDWKELKNPMVVAFYTPPAVEGENTSCHVILIDKKWSMSPMAQFLMKVGGNGKLYSDKEAKKEIKYDEGLAVKQLKRVKLKDNDNVSCYIGFKSGDQVQIETQTAQAIKKVFDEKDEVNFDYSKGSGYSPWHLAWVIPTAVAVLGGVAFGVRRFLQGKNEETEE